MQIDIAPIFTKTIHPPDFFPIIATKFESIMSNESIIQVFEGKNIRIVWNEQEEKYYFAVADIVQVMTDTTNPTDYLKKMRQRDKELSKGWGQIVTPLLFQTAGGKQKINFADLEGIFRIIQSIPSKKAEPVKQWLAEVGAQRVDQMIDPELTFQMAVADYRRQGYSDQWINERMKSIMTRKALTDEWERVGIKEKQEFAILTNILTKAWSGMTTGQYKAFKGLTKENLRDNMTSVEVALNTLAEASTRELSQQRNPKGFEQSKQTAKDGGGVAKAARDQLEKQLGRSIISPAKASDYLQPAEDVDAKELTDGKE